MLNPDLDIDALRMAFAEDGRVRIVDVLDTEIAERVREHCLNVVPYEYMTFIGGENVAIPADELTKFTPQQMQDMQRDIIDAAADGIGFFYSGYMMRRKVDDDVSDEIRFLHSVFDYLNSDAMLDFVSTVTEHDDLRSADAQFTRYTQGQFLTRHRDDVTEEQRRLAYVISFSEEWHPDWGGLLQFYQDDGTPRDSWAPQFNTMSLFDIRHVHSVTYVTPFAKQPRLSLTGWFRARDW